MFRISRILKILFSLFSFKFILTLWIIINILNKVQSQFTLKRRFTHNAHLIDNKLWFFGGGTMINGILSPTGDVFYIDLTKPFDTTNVPYVAKAASPFSCAWCLSAIGGVNQSKIFFFAGLMVRQDLPNVLTTSMIYSFDIKTQTWSPAPAMKGMAYTRRRELQPVTDKDGKIYMFGGGSDMLLGFQTIQVYNTMSILNSVDNTWTAGPLIYPPLSKIDYTATLLPNGDIVYIGGSQTDVNAIHFDVISMNKIDIYDTIGNTWSTMTATGETITERTGHTAVLNKKGEIIIFGGVYAPTLVASQPQIAVLDTSVNPFRWSIPIVNSKEMNPPPLIFHTANLVENYMIVAFGNITRSNANEGQSDQLYVLDINTFTWVKNYNPLNNSIPFQEPQSSKSLDKTMIIIIVVIVVVIFIGVAIGVIIYRRKIKQLDDKLTVYQPYIVDQQVPASQIDSESIYTSSSNVPVTSKDINQFNRDIKQLPSIPSNSSGISSVNHNYASANITHGANDTNHYVSNDTVRQYVDNNNNNMAHQYASNNNITRQSLGNKNNVAHQYASNNNTIRQSVGGNNNNVAHQYASNNNTIRQSVGGNNNNVAHQYASNNNTTRRSVGGNNNMAHQYANNNNNTTRQYAGNNNTAHYNTDTNIAPSHERFNLPPDQPYRVVMMNTESGEMYIPPNAQTTSNYNNLNRFSQQ
ncbi:unnamed protein product [Rhizophagus irregularis]|uniref:Attractin/MKLN-like beta-propeller domain-containing protein n=4 Tax=Rhizophagus irregularis TaxID=588596 RepID=A0A916E3K8_9GLOM|nr:unnamed protein product [Rhizophagus irregularis]CAB5359589.1 unnamed protein product [Rhizophagus irregularis]